MHNGEVYKMGFDKIYDGVYYRDEKQPLIDGKYNGGVIRYFLNHKKMRAIKVFNYNDVSYGGFAKVTDITVFYKNGKTITKEIIGNVGIGEAHMMFHSKLSLWEKFLGFFGAKNKMYIEMER